MLWAHARADFVLQTDRMVASKRHPLALTAHGAVVLATAALALGVASPWILALTAVHPAIDRTKSRSRRSGIWPIRRRMGSVCLSSPI
ncbi:MAG: DUF3307 domain-containing protein [Pseudorhodobacter sp.]|nr:DUF3307 domain-containing protein [Pseudorhodobacter sp.]